MSIARKVMEEPGKYSIQQLQKAMQDGTLPAYIAIPLIQEKTQLQKQFQQQQMMRQPPVKEMPPIAQQVMQEARMAQAAPGVEGLPSNLPQEYAAGGIVAFGNGGEVERYAPGGSTDDVDLSGFAEALARQQQDIGGYFSGYTEPIKKRRWNPFTNSYDPLTPEQEAQLAAGESELKQAYGVTPTQAVPSAPTVGRQDMMRATRAMTGAPAAGEPDAGEPGAGAPVGITGLGPSGVKRPYIPSAKQAVTEAYYGTETEPGFMARAAARDAKLEEGIKQAEGKVPGKALEGYEASLRKEAEQFGADKEQAKNWSIFMSGLAMMAGTSRHALQNIGAGAMVGAENYQKATADLKKAQKDNERRMAEIEQVRRAEAIGDRDRAIARLDKANALAESRDAHLTNAFMNAGIKDVDRAVELYKVDLDKETKLRVAQMHKEATLGAAQMRTEGRGEMTAANRLAAMKLLENREPAIHQKAIAMLGFKPDMKNPKHVNAYNEAKAKVTRDELNDILRTVSGEEVAPSQTPTVDLGSQGYKVIKNP